MAAYSSTAIIIVSSPYDNVPIRIGDRFTWGPYDNGPVREPQRSFDRMLEDFRDAVVETQRYRKELYRTMRAEECEARMSPKPVPEAQFKKPTFVRRACGGRWRVMRP